MSAIDEQSPLESRVATYIRQSLDAGFDEQRFNELACEVHSFQFRNNEPFARYCRALGADGSITNWRIIPGVPQQAFKHADLRAFSAGKTTATFLTSGTTGEGRGRHHFRSLAMYELALQSGWRHAGLPVNRPHFILIPPPGEAPNSSLSHMMGALSSLASDQIWLAHAKGAQLFIDLDQLREAAGRATGPVVVLGTALSFLHLFEALGHASLALPAGSVAFETGGYKGSGRELAKAALYAQFRHHLGLEAEEIWNEYGMTELSSQCYARGLRGAHRSPPWLRAVVIDPESGEPAARGSIGALRLFDLANVGSVLGVQTQDLARQVDEDSFELLGRDPAALPRGCSRAADEMLSIRS